MPGNILEVVNVFSCLYTDPSVESMIWWDIMDLLICWNDPLLQDRLGKMHKAVIT